MLVLARKSRESIVVGNADSLQEMLRLKVIEVRSGIVKLGFEANHDVAIYREEVWDRLCAERQTVDPKQDIQPAVLPMSQSIADHRGDSK
jgi:carbon storage regulator CsrA